MHIAVFAHNESGRITAGLRSIVIAAGSHPVEVIVVANGCSDSTVDEVRACASFLSHLSLVEIDIADKANAWNTYVHDVLDDARVSEADVCFFMDGDITLERDVLPLLASALHEVPGARAAGGLPATGRDREAWRQRMIQNGSLAGSIYGLRGTFIQELRRLAIRMPVGLIGDDLFLSWLVDRDVSASTLARLAPASVFHVGAEFSFRSLSPLRPADYRTYVRRQWRYIRRALQHEMLTGLLSARGLSAMPADVRQLYRRATPPSRLRWIGVATPFRTLAVLLIRSHRK
ncbi:MAG: glycosyltransferase [Vicinamibacterales bacterium]